jgi:hypothetical protein
MKNIRRFWRLRAADQALCLRAIALTFFIRIGLWLVPFQALRAGLSKLSKPRLSPDHTLERLAWAIRTAGICVPCSTCLIEALALQVLLRRRSIDCNLRLGVAHHETSGIVAHAWLESEGRVVIGNRQLDLYSPLM